MGKQSNQSTGWKQSLKAVLKQHNGATADGSKRASYATQKQREQVLWRGFRDLRELGFHFETVYALRGKSITKLVRQWEQLGKSPATIQNYLSVFRTFSGWIEKRGLVKPVEQYVKNLDSAKRTYKATEPLQWVKEWKSPDLLIKLMKSASMGFSGRFAASMALQAAFGLRVKESFLLRVHVADQGTWLAVEHGTKGGRSRVVPICTETQRVLLEKLKSEIPQGQSLVPREYTYVSFRNKYYYALHQLGISRKDGVVSHNFRRFYLEGVYQKTTGHEAPVNGGMLPAINPALDEVGRRVVAHHAGHNRTEIAAAYIGGKSAK